MFLIANKQKQIFSVELTYNVYHIKIKNLCLIAFRHLQFQIKELLLKVQMLIDIIKLHENLQIIYFLSTNDLLQTL